MKRGTTPTHAFTVPFELADVEKVMIVYAQNDVEILCKYTEDCTITGRTITTKLTQEETLLFDPLANAQIEIALGFKNGDVLRSDIVSVSVRKCLNEEVL